MKDLLKLFDQFGVPSNFKNFVQFWEKTEEPFIDIELIIDGQNMFNRLVKTKEKLDVIIFAQHGSGSLIGFWNHQKKRHLSEVPIVWIDSNGEPNSVIAKTFDDFLKVLPFDLGIFYDVASAWVNYNLYPELYEYPINDFDEETLSSYIKDAKESYPAYSEFISWLDKTAGLKQSESPHEIILNAIKTEPDFSRYLKAK